MTRIISFPIINGRILFSYEWYPGDHLRGYIVDAETFELVGENSDTIYNLRDKATAEVLTGRVNRIFKEQGTGAELTSIWQANSL